MESTIVFNQQDGKAYRLEEGKMLLLGNGALMTPAWNDVVYQIGERLFICENGNYRRIASNSMLLPFENVCEGRIRPAQIIGSDQDENCSHTLGQQIFVSGGNYWFVHHDRHDVSALPEKLARVWMDHMANAVPMPNAENAFLINSDGEFRLYMTDESGIPRLKPAPQPSISGGSFVWSGCGYGVRNKKCLPLPFLLRGIFAEYLLLELETDIFMLDEKGFHPLGSYPDFYFGADRSQKLMIAEVAHGRICYQLCRDTVRKVCFAGKETHSFLEVRKDGSVSHRYEVADGNRGMSCRYQIYRPDDKGLYVAVTE